jgi:exodeoxyribonuclease V gamma subunit
MAGFTLFTGNQLEQLARKLATRTRVRSVDPFIPEIVVIQSRGMERWLALEIAHHSGIAANLVFPFPEAFLQTVTEAILPHVKKETLFNRETMALGIYALLPGLIDTNPAFGPLRAYLREDGSGLKRIQLAEQVSQLFDQYLVFRPDMIYAWDTGQAVGDTPHHVWQAALWRELMRRMDGKTHRARLWKQLLATLHREAVSVDKLPQRVSVFGISYLPPFYLQALVALSAVMTVDFYQLNPCREFWADIVSQKEENRLRRTGSQNTVITADEDLHREEGNRLLASMGSQGRTFHRLIGEFDMLSVDDFRLNPANTLLADIQNDILFLKNHPHGEKHHFEAHPTDRSVQVHACHGPMREIEVLYDQVLDLLNTDFNLEPRDIMVLTPDIETYAPYIQAVFGAPEDGALRIPFSIADRGPLACNPVVEAFLFLLTLNQSRLAVSEILNLLDVSAVRSRFDLADEDMRLIRQWISETRIRWGADATAKSRLALPPTETNTWQAGLDRLLMGYALSPEGDVLFKGVLPAGGAEGSDAEVLGHLERFLVTLTQWQTRLSASRILSEWSSHLLLLIDDFFKPVTPDDRDLLLLRRLIAEMEKNSMAAGVSEPVGIEVVGAVLKRHLEAETSDGGFISGGITFGALLPMRSIPAKVVCLVGLNQDTFPREDRPLGFDLMVADPRIGDRSRRNDDKYLFLEALISARRYFYLSYCGHDRQDNTILPPSVLVSELIDYLVEGYPVAENDLVTRHRLQAFSPAYFSPENSRLFSYSRHARDAADSLVTSRQHPTETKRFLSAPLSEWDASFQTVALKILAQAVTHPCRFLLEQRLQVQLNEYRLTEDDREHFTLDPLDHFALGQSLLQNLLTGPLAPETFEKVKAAGQLPHGDPGRLRFKALCEEAKEMADAVKAIHGDTLSIAVPVQIWISPYTITGVLENIFPSGQLCYRFSITKGMDLMGAWLRHLVWCRMDNETEKGVTTVINRDGRRRFRRVDNPDAHLAQLLAVYYRAGHEPLPLFPRSSWAYAVRRFENADPVDKALKHVRSLWHQSFKRPGEGEDPYIQYCYGDTEPLDQAFVDITEAVYGPMMQHVERI